MQTNKRQSDGRCVPGAVTEAGSRAVLRMLEGRPREYFRGRIEYNRYAVRPDVRIHDDGIIEVPSDNEPQEVTG